MPIDPQDYVDYQVQGIPYDKNRKGLSVVTGAVVNGAGDIIGYLPLKVNDNGDGTASLDVTTTIVFDPDVDIGDVHLLNTSGIKIDPATEQKQDDIITGLANVLAAVDGLESIDFATEITLQSIESEVQGINSKDFATETTLAAIQALITSIDNDIDVALSTRASEVTLQAVSTKLDTVNSLLTSLDGKDYATETTLSSIQTAVDSIDSDIDVALSTRASEATLSSAKSVLDNIKSALDTLNATDFSTETTLASVLTELQSIDSKDFATETTLSLIKTAIDSINTSVDVALSTRASETTLANAKDVLDDIKTALDTLNATDFATETTLASLKTAVDSIDSDIDVALSTRASEVTLQSVESELQDINAIDFATETTLSGVKTQTDKLTFAATRLIVDGSQVTQPVEGESADSAAVTENPVLISGADSSSNKRTVLTDPDGKVYVLASPTIEREVEDGLVFTGYVEQEADGTEETLMLLRNPGGSGKVIILHNIYAALRDDGSDPMSLKFYKTPTITATGTSVTLVNTHIGSAVSAASLMYSEPTVSANGTQILEMSFARDNTNPPPISGRIQIDAGNDLLITMEGAGTDRDWGITLMISERGI